MTEGYICIDCVFYHEVGEEPSEKIGMSLAEFMDRAGHAGKWINDCGDNNEFCVDFSRGSCDSCGSTLGGTRHRAFLRD